MNEGSSDITDMDARFNRRQILQTSGVVGAASLAGCMDAFGDDGAGNETDDGAGNESDTDPDIEPEIDPADGITGFVQLDEEAQAELAELETELVEEIEAEELDQMEAQQIFQERQAELNAAAVTEFQTYSEDVEGLPLEGTVSEMGIVLLDGEGEAILQPLRDEAVGALFPGEEFEASQAPAPEEP